MQMPTMSRARRAPRRSYSLVLPTTSANRMATSISLPIRTPLYLIQSRLLEPFRPRSPDSVSEAPNRAFQAPPRDARRLRTRTAARRERPPAHDHHAVQVPGHRLQAYPSARAALGVGDDALDDFPGFRPPPCRID